MRRSIASLSPVMPGKRLPQVLRQGFHPARTRPREPGHPADQLALSLHEQFHAPVVRERHNLRHDRDVPALGHRAGEIRHIRAGPPARTARQTASSPGDRTIVLCPLRRLYVSAVSSGILQPPPGCVPVPPTQ
ncbi:MAG: hypothetical protein ACLRWP_06170 [Bilophila wadsworthia]